MPLKAIGNPTALVEGCFIKLQILNSNNYIELKSSYEYDRYTESVYKIDISNIAIFHIIDNNSNIFIAIADVIHIRENKVKIEIETDSNIYEYIKSKEKKEQIFLEEYIVENQF